MNIVILGAGAYGLALANILSDKNKVTVYSVKQEEIDNLNKTYKNNIILPNVELSKNITFTADDDVIRNADLIVIAIPTNYIDEVIKNIKHKINKNTKICIATKGINKNLNKFPYEIVKQETKNKNIYILSGPSFAIDTAKKEKIILTLAGNKAEQIKDIFPENYVKIETTKDIIGTQVCGTIKNIFAIASGILEGMNASDSTKAAFLTKVINETNDIILKLNGSKNTILNACGIGDILLTCTSKNSRNFSLGYLIGQNEDKTKIQNYINNTTVEGLEALISIKEVLKTRNINNEIINLIYNVIYNNEDINKLLKYIVN